MDTAAHLCSVGSPGDLADGAAQGPKGGLGFARAHAPQQDMAVRAASRHIGAVGTAEHGQQPHGWRGTIQLKGYSNLMQAAAHSQPDR
jgi:hypothetical protein